MTGLADNAVRSRYLDAHRHERLASAQRIHVRFSSGGLAFRLKGQPDALSDARASFAPDRQRITVQGERPRPWVVDIGDTDALAQQLATLTRGRRRLRWTPEDVGVFAAAALWTYITMPLLVRDTADAAVRPGARGSHRLTLDLGGRVAGHAPRQVLHIDPGGLLVRHDYIASAFGRWAHAAQTIEDYEVADGAPVGTRRRVTPRLGRWQLAGPTLVWIRIHELTLVPAT